MVKLMTTTFVMLVLMGIAGWKLMSEIDTAAASMAAPPAAVMHVDHR